MIDAALKYLKHNSSGWCKINICFVGGGEGLFDPLQVIYQSHMLGSVEFVSKYLPLKTASKESNHFKAR